MFSCKQYTCDQMSYTKILFFSPSTFFPRKASSIIHTSSKTYSTCFSYITLIFQLQAHSNPTPYLFFLLQLPGGHLVYINPSVTLGSSKMALIRIYRHALSMPFYETNMQFPKVKYLICITRYPLRQWHHVFFFFCLFCIMLTIYSTLYLSYSSDFFNMKFCKRYMKNNYPT